MTLFLRILILDYYKGIKVKNMADKISKKKTGFLWGLFCLGLFLADRFTKLYMLKNLEPIGSKPVIDGFLQFTFVENRGAAFGILQGKTWVFVLLTIVIGAAIIYFMRKLIIKSKYPEIVFALCLILAGAIGNFYDRIAYGYVVDFFDLLFVNFAIFNVADIFVVCGAVILVLLILFDVKEDF